MRLHIEALFTHDAEGDLLRVADAAGAPAPRFFLGWTGSGVVCRFRHDVDRQLRRELDEVIRDDARRERDAESPIDPAPYEAILARAAPVEHTWTGSAFRFPSRLRTSAGAVRVTEENAGLLRPLLEPWIADVRTGQPLYALVVGGRAVSVCCSVRRTAKADEAGVETAAGERGRGYAGPVVSAWARAVREAGRVPLYSTSWRNEASRAVARKVGLICFGSDLHIR